MALTITFLPIEKTYGLDVTASSGNPSDIQNAINQVISSGGGTVYVPAGDWRVDQKPVQPYGQGGAISIDLETLPSGAWLNIIGLGGVATVTTQNGQTIQDAPKTILRSYTVVNNNLTSPYATFGIVGSNAGSSNFNAIKSTNRHIRISGLTILGDVINDGTVSSQSNIGISLSFVDGYLIDNVVIDSNTGSGISSSYSKGVISHVVITDLYHAVIGGVWGYGVSVAGNEGFYANGFGDPTWIKDINQVIGKYDWQGISLDWMTPINGDLSTKGTTSSISFTAGPVYVEDSTFYQTRHPVSSSRYGYYVLRDSIMFGGVGIQMVDQHGGGYNEAANAYAGRGCEIYNNAFTGSTANYGTGTHGVMLRGGAGLIFNNTFNNVYTGITLGNENYNSGYPTYPEYVNDVWIWGNTFNSVSTSLGVNSGVGITAGVNYFSDIPTPTTPAPPKSGYASYTYPHPLASGISPPTPATEWSITITSTAGGSTYPTGTQSIQSGNSLQISATPTFPYVFEQWIFDSSPYGTTPSITIPSQTEGTTHTLQAVFKLPTNETDQRIYLALGIVILGEGVYVLWIRKKKS